METQVITRDWTTRHVPAWRNWLEPFVGREDVVALEVGVHVGRTSRWFCENILTGPRARLDCIDPWRDRADHEAAFDAATEGLAVRKLKGYSNVVLPALRVADAKYQFIYVDGQHYAGAVLFDLVLCWTMLARGGVLIADDYTWTKRNQRYPARVGIESWMACIRDEMTGYEVSRCGQVAVWRR